MERLCRRREGKLDSRSGGREGPPLGTQRLLAGEGAPLPAGAGLWARTGSVHARLPNQWPRAGKMSGVFAQARGGQSPRFILLIPQTFVKLWPPYLDPLGGWFSSGPGLSPSCMHGGESWGKCGSFTWGLMVEKSRLKWDRELGCETEGAVNIPEMLSGGGKV